MTNIKKTLLVIAAFVGFIGLNNSVLANVAPPPPAPAAAFELYNKSKNEIRVELKAPNAQPIKFTIPKNGKKDARIAIDAPLTLMIGDEAVGSSEEYSIKAPGKTKYLTWDPSKAMPLYPRGVTEGGSYSLSNNITSSNIRKE